MSFSKIVFLDDLLREDFIHSRAFIYQLIREPLKQVLGLSPPDLRSFPLNRGLITSFQMTEFKKYCNDSSWVENYLSVTEAANQYLTDHIPEDAIVIGYEMPLWLVKALKINDTPWINIRLSPIRFSRDLYIVLQSSFFNLQEILSNRQVTDQEIRLEAGLMSAAVLHNQLYKYSSEMKMNNGIVFIGQTQADASLIDENGKLLRVKDFTDEIKKVIGDRQIYYKPHPSDKSWARTEKKALEEITGSRIKSISQSTYSLLAGNMHFDVIGISSGVLQEAEFFERHSITLHRSVCDFRAKDCCHIRFIDFISPSLWGKIFKNDEDSFSPVELPLIPQNMMRSLHNSWWGYSNYMFENNKFYEDAAYFGLKSKIKRAFYLLTNKG